MELNLKSLCLLSVILILMAILPNDGRPPKTNSSIPKEKCYKVVKGLPDKFHNCKIFNRLLFKCIPGPLCFLLSESQKTARLQEVGGFVPRYVAVNRTEALQFVSLLGDVQPILPNSSYYNQSGLSSNLHQQGRTSGNKKRRSTITLPSVAGTTTIQQCFNGGSLLEDVGFRRLCTECFAISQLPDGVFPPFINEVICGDDSDFCVPNIGRCQQKVLKLNFLNFTGEFERDDDLSDLFDSDVFVEKLDPIEVEIRACCECRLFAFLGKK